jgi:hypothetical protein
MLEHKAEVVLIWADGESPDSSTTAAGTHTPSNKASTDRIPGTPAMSGLAFQTWCDSWTFCKATARYTGHYHWVPWLGGLSAIISAISGTAVFISIQENQVATWQKVAVGSVAIATAVIAALQNWVSTRVKGLKDQRDKFHELHRSIERDLEDGQKTFGSEYAKTVEAKLKDITAGMNDLSPGTWDKAKGEMWHDMLTKTWLASEGPLRIKADSPPTGGGVHLPMVSDCSNHPR